MICPACGEEMLGNIDRAIRNVKTYLNGNYENNVCVLTKCCNELITLRAKVTVTAEMYSGDSLEDDWGESVCDN